MPIPEVLSGETRIETRNAGYKLHDGICYSVRRDDPHGRLDPRLDPSAFIGMRVVGWLWQDDPRSVLSLEWRPGAYAVLWRRGHGPADRSAVALTSATVAFRNVTPTVPVRADTCSALLDVRRVLFKPGSSGLGSLSARAPGR